MKYDKKQGKKGPKVIAKEDKLEERIKRIENETGIGPPSWARN